MTKLISVCEFQSGLWKGKKGPFAKANVIRNTNFRPNGNLSYENIALLDVESKELAKRELQHGDIILEKSGGGAKTPVGRVCLFEKQSSEIPCSLSNFTSLIRVKDSSILNYKYLHKFLYFMYTSGKTEPMQRHSTGIRNLQLKEYKNISIPLPPLAEQQRIVAKLDATFAEIDNAKETTETNIINANLFFLNYLMKVFESKNKDWDENNLKELTTKIGSGSTPRGGNESYKNSGTSLIRSMNVHDKGFVYNKLAFIDDIQAKKLNIVNIEKDDVLINITGASVARCCIVPNDVLPARVNQHVSILRTKKNILNPKLLHFILTSPYHKNKLLKVGEDGGATRQAITKNQLEEYVIRFPKNYNLQSELVKKNIDVQTLSLKMKSIYENKLKNFIQLKQSILKQELNGELKKAS